jgi:cyclic-di-GMP-binding biofilm dispersal mediator protein
MVELRNKSILVVGASGDLGGSIASELAAAGARLTLAGRDGDRLRRLGLPEAATVEAELTDPNAARALIAAAVDRHGALDGLVNAAGVVAFGAVSDLDDDIVDQLLLVNYLAPLRLTRQALTVLPPGGFVLNISAVVAEHPMANMSAYSASKAALTAFDAAARIEGRRKKIRVIDARPPHTETGLALRPIAGQAPKLPTGLSPAEVAQRMVRAIVDEELDLPSSAFVSDGVAR